MEKTDGKLGERIRAIRRGKKLTLVEFGELLGRSKTAVGQYENGVNNPDYDTLIAIAELGKVSLDWLLTGSEKPAGWVVAVSPEDLGYPPVQDDDEERCEPEQCNETEAEYVTLEASREEAMILAHIRELPARDVRIVKETVEGLWFNNKSKQEKKQRKKDLEIPENL